MLGHSSATPPQRDVHDSPAATGTAAKWRIDERLDHSQNALTEIVERVSQQAIACQFDTPVIGLEDLSYIRERLDDRNWMNLNRRLHA
jgi:hypothetical protein